MDPAPTAFGLTLQLLRQQRGLSLNALGRAAGVDPAYLWRLERGEKQDPSLSVLRKICLGLEISPQTFLRQLEQVEESLATGVPAALHQSADSEERGTDAAIFAEVLAERSARDQLRATLAEGFPRRVAPPPPAGRIARTIRVPLLGRIAAGQPLRVEETDVLDWLTVAAQGLPRDPQLFALEVQGDSLIGDGLEPGDVVIISPKRAFDLTPEAIGVCRLFGAELTLKHVWETRAGYLLRGSNPAVPDVEVAQGDLDILGMVVRVLKRPQERVD